MKHELIYKGKSIENFHWAEFSYNGIYNIEYELTLVGNTRLHLWVNHDPELRDIFYSCLASWCCGDDLEMVKRLTKVIIGIIDMGETQNMLHHSIKRPVHLDQKFMHWIKVQEQRIPVMEIPIVTKLIIKQKYKDEFLRIIRKQFVSQ